MLSVIIKQLPGLNQQELKTLKAAIDELTHRCTDENEPPLYDVLRRVIGTTVPYSAFQATDAYKHWRRHNQSISTFMGLYFPDASKVQRLALMTFIVRALVNDLKGRSVSITVGSVVKNLGRFGQMFEKEFPDYLSSGMAPLILKSLKER
jgi:hypothetical protein